MVVRGGGSGTPSYQKVVVDRGKGPREVGCKTPLLGSSGSVSEQQGEENHEKQDIIEEENTET
jgi:hypothetical protein